MTVAPSAAVPPDIPKDYLDATVDYALSVAGTYVLACHVSYSPQDTMGPHAASSTPLEMCSALHPWRGILPSLQFLDKGGVIFRCKRGGSWDHLTFKF